MLLFCRNNHPDCVFWYQMAQTVLEATRALQDFDKLRTRNLISKEHEFMFLILDLAIFSKPMAKFIARSTFLMDYLGIGSFFVFTFRVFILNFQIDLSCRFVVGKIFHIVENSGTKMITTLRMVSAILAVATKSQLKSIRAWDLDVEQLLLRELESSASAPGFNYNAVSTS